MTASSVAPAQAGAQFQAPQLGPRPSPGRQPSPPTGRAHPGNFANAAAGAGVKRIVYLGGLVPQDADSEHLVSRKLTGDRLREGSVPVTEVRAGIIVGLD